MTETYPRKRRIWPIVLVGTGFAAALALCVVGALTSMDPNGSPAPRSTPAATATGPGLIAGTAAGKAATAGAPKAKPGLRTTIDGDDIVHVGEDVTPGTYRAVGDVDQGTFSFCVWTKSKDAEGADVIDFGAPTGGRPQVTLKAGQWFKSAGCPEWAAK